MIPQDTMGIKDIKVPKETKVLLDLILLVILVHKVTKVH